MSNYQLLVFTSSFISDAVTFLRDITEGEDKNPRSVLKELLYRAMEDQLAATMIEYETYARSTQISAESVLKIAERAALKRLEADNIEISHMGTVTYSSPYSAMKTMFRGRKEYADVVKFVKEMKNGAEGNGQETRKVIKSDKDEKREPSVYNRFMKNMIAKIEDRFPDITKKVAFKLAVSIWNEYMPVVRAPFSRVIMSKEQRDIHAQGGDDILERYATVAEFRISQGVASNYDEAFRIILNMRMQDTPASSSQQNIDEDTEDRELLEGETADDE